MSKYEALWTDLKKEKYIQLQAPESTHATIMRGLRRESMRDTVARLKCVEEGRSFYIAFNSINDLLLLRLEYVDRVSAKFTGPRGYRV